MQLFEIVAWIGTLLSFGLNIPSCFHYWNIFKGKAITYDEFPFKLMFRSLSSEFWACYWTRQNFFLPFISSIIQLTFSEIFLVIYFYIYSEKKCIKYIFLILAASVILFSIYYISIILIPHFYIVGILALLSNLISYSFSIEKENSNKVSIISGSILTFTYLISWLLFGLLVKDFKVILNSVLGLVICLINNGVLAISHFKEKKKNYGFKRSMTQKISGSQNVHDDEELDDLDV